MVFGGYNLQKQPKNTFIKSTPGLLTGDSIQKLVWGFGDLRKTIWGHDFISYGDTSITM
jgi:hypothetical protein